MKSVRKYGKKPFKIALAHGGPGAAGEMTPVAKEISRYCAVLEPFQTALSLDGQVEELKFVIEKYGKLPITLVGYSWGAWLVFILVAKYPRLAKKLILVSSGPFKSKYAQSIMKVRLDRLSKPERRKAQELLKQLEGFNEKKLGLLKKFGKLISKADAYDPLPDEKIKIKIRQDIYQSVWPEASELRRNGKLLELGKKIKCPVVAIHGDYDPHPARGVQKPLSGVLKKFKFILLKKCGHKPWAERMAKDKFYKILKNQLLN